MMQEVVILQLMKYVTIKVLEDTRRLLRLIAAQTGEQMIQVLQRLCAAEWERRRPVHSAVRSSGQEGTQSGQS